MGFTFFLKRCSESRSGSVENGVLLYTCQKLCTVLICAISFSWSSQSCSVGLGFAVCLCSQIKC